VNLDIPPGSPFLQAAFYLLAAVIVAATARLGTRFFAGVLAWVAAVSAVSFAGLLVPGGSGPPLPFVIMLASVIGGGIVIARSRTGDRLARTMPFAVLVGFQSFRLPLELVMHRAFTEGVMPGQMSYSGRNFDIVTGATALLLAIALAITDVPRWVIAAWNWMGLLLLANIVGIAVASTPMFAVFGPENLNVFVMRMPYTLLPAVMVLAAWAGHLIVWKALSLRGPSTPDPR
jgi:hypothetical protein